MKRSNKTLSALLFTLAVVFCGALLPLGYFALIRSPLLALTQVEFRGVQLISEQDFAKKIKEFLGKPLYGISLNEIRATMELNPQVKSVTIQRRPPHTLIIEVSEHKLVAVAALEKLYVVNDQGQIIPGKYDTQLLPLISGLKNSQSSYSSKMLGLATQALAYYHDSGKALGRIKRIHIHQQLGLISYHENDEKVTLGFDHFEKKWTYLSQVAKFAKYNQKKLTEVYLAKFAVANHVPVRFDLLSAPNR